MFYIEIGSFKLFLYTLDFTDISFAKFCTLKIKWMIKSGCFVLLLRSMTAWHFLTSASLFMHLLTHEVQLNFQACFTNIPIYCNWYFIGKINMYNFFDVAFNRVLFQNLIQFLSLIWLNLCRKNDVERVAKHLSELGFHVWRFEIECCGNLSGW